MHSPKHRLVEFVNVARSLIGKPWRHRGCSVHEVDCVGLVVYSAKQVGILPITYQLPAYSTKPQPHIVLAELQRFATRVNDPAIGNIVFFSTGKRLVHVAIVSGPRSLVHADRNHGFVSEVPWTAPWNKIPYTLWELK